MTAVSKAPARLDITVVQGDSYSDSFTFSQSGAPINASTWSHLAQVRAERTAGAPLLATFTVGTGSASTGVIALSLSAATTAGLEPGRYWWEYERTVGSDVRTMLSGEFVVLDQVAKP